MKKNQDTGVQYGNISMFFVEKSCRGQGIEGELLRICLKAMQDKGAEYVTTRASMETEAHKFFELEKYGFLCVLGKYNKKDARQK